SDIYSLFKKQNFSGNEYLNSLQKGSNYFRFQYFNPLNASKYYENLDEQVLALITGEIGSMPDLKKPNDKDKGSRSAFKNHSADEITTNDNEQSDDYNKNKKLDRVLITLGSAIVAIFAGVVGMFIYNRRKNQQ
ncbi:SdrH family protein, partial [Staphylococcus capitis]